MNLTDVKAVAVPRKKPKRVGRGIGSGHGKTCGRGTKGAKSRAGFGGHKLREGGQMPLYRRLPKRGFNNANFKKQYATVNVGQLNKFEAGSTVDPETMEKAGLFKKAPDGVKILGKGELKVALTVMAHKFSESARKKIAEAGGEAKEIQ